MALSMIFFQSCALKNLSIYQKCMLTENNYTLCKVRQMQYDELKYKKDQRKVDNKEEKKDETFLWSIPNFF